MRAHSEPADLDEEIQRNLDETRRWTRMQRPKEARDASVTYAVLVDKRKVLRQQQRDEELHAQKIAGQTAEELAAFLSDAMDKLSEMIGLPARELRMIVAEWLRQWTKGDELEISREQAELLQAGVRSVFYPDIRDEVEAELGPRVSADVVPAAIPPPKAKKSWAPSPPETVKTPDVERQDPERQVPEPKVTLVLGKEPVALSAEDQARREAEIHNNDEYWKR